MLDSNLEELELYAQKAILLDVYSLAKKLLVQINEVNFRDGALYAYCPITRVIEVQQDLPQQTKNWIIGHCLSKFY